MPTLLIDNGKDRVGGIFYGPLLIGRRAANAVVVEDPQVDLVHAWISSGPAGYFVANIAQRGQTLVNGQPVSGRQTLNDGDVIEIGSALHITYRTEAFLPAGYRPIELHWRGPQIPNVDEPIVFPCACGATIALTPVFSGTMSRCPACGRVVDVPFESVRPPEPPPAPVVETPAASRIETQPAAPPERIPIEDVPAAQVRPERATAPDVEREPEPEPEPETPWEPAPAASRVSAADVASGAPPAKPPEPVVPIVVHSVSPLPGRIVRFSQTEIVEEPLDEEPGTSGRRSPGFETLAPDAPSPREHAFDLPAQATPSNSPAPAGSAAEAQAADTVEERAPLIVEELEFIDPLDVSEIVYEEAATDQPLPVPTPPAAGARPMCGICNSDISQLDETMSCPDCGRVFHFDCWMGNWGCSSSGCSQVNAARPAEAKAAAEAEAAPALAPAPVAPPEAAPVPPPALPPVPSPPSVSVPAPAPAPAPVFAEASNRQELTPRPPPPPPPPPQTVVGVTPSFDDLASPVKTRRMRVDPGRAAESRRPLVDPARLAAVPELPLHNDEVERVPWELAALGGSIIALLLSALSFGVPSAIAGAVIVRMFQRREVRYGGALIACAVLVALGVLLGIGISAHLWLGRGSFGGRR